MKKTTIQVAVLAATLLAVFLFCRLMAGNTYIARVTLPDRQLSDEDLRFTDEAPGIVRRGDPDIRDGVLSVPIQPVQPGRTYVDIDDEHGNDIGLLPLDVSPFGTVYDRSSGGFTGDTIALWAFTFFCFAVAIIMFRTYKSMKGPSFYSYGTIYTAGFSLFALLTGVTMLIVTLRHVLDPHNHFSMLSAYSAISSASWQFMAITSPLVILFALAMAISNAALWRHEGFSAKNALGIGISLSLLAGEAVAFVLYSRDVSGSEWQVRLWNTLCNVYATGFAWFECMLLGAIVCGLRAARHTPPLGADYILILGCKFRRDGTLTPLLRGRVEEAIAFWKRQLDATGKQAVLMPSGGQGKDEPLSEAEAMRRYLCAQGIPEDSIAVEDRSRNTFENMANCRELIAQRGSGTKVVYATTNYHVFRSGVWANLAGLPAEGVGSRTRWWYWPNAFMRECAGLMLNRIPQELLLLAAMLVFFGALSMTLG